MAVYGGIPVQWRPMAKVRLMAAYGESSSNGGLRRILVVLRPMANRRLVAAYGELPYNGGLWRTAVQWRPKANWSHNGGLWRIPGLHRELRRNRAV
jgi:hypothetical protein